MAWATSFPDSRQCLSTGSTLVRRAFSDRVSCLSPIAMWRFRHAVYPGPVCEMLAGNCRHWLTLRLARTPFAR